MPTDPEIQALRRRVAALEVERDAYSELLLIEYRRRLRPPSEDPRCSMTPHP